LTKLPTVSGMDVVKYLSRKGFYVSHRKGSHVVLRKGDRRVVVPLHNELKPGTLLAILKQAGISREEFMEEI
jgi:predicted RNA binding protein YcfA (HicA-like mRNA interferase family)